jgi:6-phosphogluconolactonase
MGVDMQNPNIKVYPGPAEVAKAAAELFLDQALEAVEQRGVFSVALSGGATPARLFELLTQPGVVEKVPWEKVAVFWGDERAVPPDHPDSNFRAAKALLLDLVPLQRDNIFRISAELDPRLAAGRYEKRLLSFLGFEGDEHPELEDGQGLDLIFLGMGGDGHTASLFPHTPALNETDRWVVGNYIDQLGTWRVTMTAPFINSARKVVFLVVGGGKKTRLKDVLEGPRDPATLPSQLIGPRKGELIWIVDEAAAELLG